MNVVGWILPRNLLQFNDDIKPLWMTLPTRSFVECTDPNFTTIVNNWLSFMEMRWLLTTVMDQFR